ncbi:hypothetical protein GALMADRAFT_821794 [Galerina marginata CBS 339.88]|uniref:F-box domain-containing protein n=1 Tax=Galerina marginata (strain CBS 339.88) TaxID=685588 RepID=A0A067TJ99_GALM3|nr:hypothetical protein GALMADRAFT_821794 [Galerina marginata CBS 339.88]
MERERFPEPRLPQDLEQLIFVRCASDWPSEPTSRLLLVAKRVHAWVRPILFQVFRQAPPFFPDFKKYPSLQLKDVGRFTKHLIIGTSNLPEDTDFLLASCPNLHNFAFWSNHSFKDAFLAIQRLPLRRLSAILDELIPEDFFSPVFSNLTHLDVISYKYDWDQWIPITSLPCLTHIAINNTQFEASVVSNLLLRIQLRALIILLGENSHWIRRYPKGERFEVDDHRLVLMTNGSLTIMMDDWESGAKGGVDFWVTAELFSLARREVDQDIVRLVRGAKR